MPDSFLQRVRRRLARIARRLRPPSARPDQQAIARRQISFAEIWDTPGTGDLALRPTVIAVGAPDPATLAHLQSEAARLRFNLAAADTPARIDEAAGASRGASIVLISAAGVPERGWLGAFEDLFRRFERAGAASGVTAPPEDAGAASVREADVLRPPLVAIRRDALEAAGGFGRHASLDDGLADLSTRLKANGFTLHVQPFARLRPASAAKPPEHAQHAQRAHPRALFVDGFTPTPDQDSGSNDIVWFMKILTGFGYEVTFVPAYKTDHAGRYTDDLRLSGIICPVAPELTSAREFIDAHGAEFDLIFIYRVTIASELIEPARKAAPKAKIVFDTVDLHFLRDLRAAELGGSPEALAQAERTRHDELRVISLADTTILLSAYEHDIVGKLLPDARLSLIPIVRPVPGRLAPHEGRRDVLFIGGFKHLPNLDAVHFLCGEIWPLVHRLLPGATLKIVGADVPEAIWAYHAPRAGIEIVGYVEDLTELYRSARLTVAPLRFGAGLKGKIVASLAVGLPCVATSIAAEGIASGDAAHLLVADTPQDFAKAVARLYADEALWNRMSDAGVAYAQENFSVVAVTEKLRLMLKQLGLSAPDGAA